MHHFEYRGLYDGVSFLSDRETGSYWHHITGEAMDGPLAGRRLPAANLLHMTVKQALAEQPDMLVALSDRPMRDERPRFWPRLERVPVLGERFKRTMAREDTRRPELDVGLGVWTVAEQRYYPLEALRAAGNVIVDAWGDRRVAIVYPQGAVAPQAFYTTASGGRWEGDVLRLDNGHTLRDGLLYDAQGRRTSLERPMQLFTRWYGYALTFPGTSVYAGPPARR